MAIINRIRDVFYSLGFSIRLGYAFYIRRDVSRCLDLLMEYKRYSINRYGIWSVKDVKYMFDMIDILGRMEIYRFEADLLRQVYDLEEAKDIKKRFGLQ